MSTRKVLQGLLAALGSAIVCIGVSHILFGPAIIPGAPAVNATLDSEDRFFGAIFVGYGAVLLWCVSDVERRLAQVKLVALVFFGGGIARLLSMAATGQPHPFFVAMTAIELGLPPLLVWLASRLEPPRLSSGG